MKTINKTITKTITKYVADDNTEWDNEEDCRNHENECAATKKLIDKLEIEELHNIMPPLHDVCEDADFIWYNIKNNDDYELISQYYKKQYDTTIEVYSLPAIICVEHLDDVDVWAYTLNEILNGIQTFIANNLLQKSLLCFMRTLSSNCSNIRSLDLSSFLPRYSPNSIKPSASLSFTCS